MNLSEHFNYEKRAFPIKIGKTAIENRAKNGQKTEVLIGYAIVFEAFATLTDRWGNEFQEKFTRDCLDETLADGHKIMALYNHSWTSLLGSTKDNLMLQLKEDGLYFELTPKAFEFDKRIIEFIKTGTIDGCSLGFRVLQDRWEEKDRQWFRIVEKIELHEMSFTPIPVYQQTSVGIELRKSQDRITLSDEERRNILLKTEAIIKYVDAVLRGRAY